VKNPLLKTLTQSLSDAKKEIMVDIKNMLWSNRAMRLHDKQQPVTQRREGVTALVQTIPARPELMGLASLLALLLILGRGAGSG